MSDRGDEYVVMDGISMRFVRDPGQLPVPFGEATRYASRGEAHAAASMSYLRTIGTPFFVLRVDGDTLSFDKIRVDGDTLSFIPSED